MLWRAIQLHVSSVEDFFFACESSRYQREIIPKSEFALTRQSSNPHFKPFSLVPRLRCITFFSFINRSINPTYPPAPFHWLFRQSARPSTNHGCSLLFVRFQITNECLPVHQQIESSLQIPYHPFVRFTTHSNPLPLTSLARLLVTDRLSFSNSLFLSTASFVCTYNSNLNLSTPYSPVTLCQVTCHVDMSRFVYLCKQISNDLSPPFLR